MNQHFNKLKVIQHPDKIFNGRIEKGFYFLGYHFSRQGLSLANQTTQHFIQHLHRLYEQQRATPDKGNLLGEYIIRWLRWAQIGLRGLSLEY